MTTALPALGLAAATLVSAVSFAQDPSAKPRAADSRTRDVLASVVDSRGAAVPGLTAADFVVREDGLAREVLKVMPATGSMQIALLIDDSQASSPAIMHLREGLTGFVDRLKGKAEIAIITVGERPTSVTQYTSDPAALKKGIGRIFAREGAGAYLLEAIVETSKGLERRDAARKVIIAVTMEAVEFSNAQHQFVLDRLYESGATFHVLAVGSPAPSSTDEMRNRNVVLAEGTERTGGRRDQLLTVMAIPDKLTQLADELLTQYVITYARPDTLIPPEKIEVTTTKPGLTARARTRVAAK
jgi:VWFA-related protein